MTLQLLIILIITGIGQVTLDLYLPSMPFLVKYFHSSPSMLQYSIGVFLIAMAFSQFIYGNISDIYGRKKTLITGMVILTLGSVICLSAKSVSVFIIGRFIQGAGVGATSNLCKAIARDSYGGIALKRVMSLMITVWASSLIFAPMLGSIIQYFLGWHYIFLTLLVCDLILFLFIYFQFNETLMKEKQAKLMFLKENSLRIIFSNYSFIINTLIVALYSSIIYLYNLEAPFLIQDKLHYSSISYGLITIIITFGYIIGSILNSILVTKYRSWQINSIATFIAFFVSIAMTSFAMTYGLSLADLVVCFSLLTICTGILIPNAMAHAFDSIKSNVGKASAVYGLFVFSSGFISNVVVSNYIKQNFFYFSLFICIILLIASILCLVRFSYHQFHSHPVQLE